MDIPCHGGMLDGIIHATEQPEKVIHQNGMTVVRVHQRYPKRKGWKVVERLVVYTEDYTLHTDEATGLAYRCNAAFAGVVIDGVPLPEREGGGYEIWVDRDGKTHATQPEEQQ